MNILVTGASGLIGTLLCQRLLSVGHAVFSQSRRERPDSASGIHIKFDLVTDSWRSVDLPKIDVIYHLAGQTSANAARQDPIGDLSGNVIALLRLMEHFKSQPTRPFVVITGTVTQVGLTERLPIDETLPDNPVTFYDISKLTAEKYLLQYVRENWIRGCALRLANVYGGPKGERIQDRGVIDRMFARACAGQNLSIYGTGEWLRDYIHLEDVVQALLSILGNDRVMNGQVYCLGTGKGISLLDAFSKVIEIAAEVSGNKVALGRVSPPLELSPIEFRNAVIDASAFRAATGWSPKYDFESGLRASYL